MAQTFTLHDTFPVHLFSGVVDLDTNTIKVMLLTNSYTANPATDEFIDDVSANECTPGGNYDAGGEALDSKVVSAITNGAKFDAADEVLAQHASNPPNIRKAVVYIDTGTPATSPIIGSITLAASDIDGTAGDLTLQWHANGLVTVTIV